MHVKAYLKAMAAKNISMQMMKFCQPAATVPAPTSCPLMKRALGMTPQRSRMARTIPERQSTGESAGLSARSGQRATKVYLPCQKDKKMTDLMVRNLSTGS